MLNCKPVPIDPKKIILPGQVPGALMERKRIWTKNGTLPRLPFEVFCEDRRAVMRTVIKEHAMEIAELMHPNIRMVGGIDGWPNASGWKKDKSGLLMPSKELILPAKGTGSAPQASFDLSNLIFMEPSKELFTELAKLQFAVWGEKDGGMKSIIDYFNILCLRDGPTPIFVYFRDNGEVESAVFPIQVRTKDVTTWDGLTFNGTWKNDTLCGDLLACPMICSYMTIGKTSKSLIVEGVRPYAVIEIFLRFIDDCIAYSRPGNYGPEDRHIPINEHLPQDPNYEKFHARNNARLVCIVEGGVDGRLDKKTGGYGFVAGYLEQVLPDEKFNNLLKGIERTVREYFNVH